MGEEAVCLEMPIEEEMTEEISETKNELKRGHLCIEEDNNIEEEELHFNKRQAKEASNDDIRSEISNPVASNASSFRDITSNPAKSSSADLVGSCSGFDDTLNDEEDSEYGVSIADSSQWSDDVPSCFVREIPKHLSTTGITKITFKLSKRNEEFCDLPIIKEQTLESVPWNVASSTLSELVFTNFPSNVKKLLATGILDGARVKYFTISPAVSWCSLCVFL